MPQEPPQQSEQEPEQRKKHGPYDKRLVIRNMTFDQIVTKIARFRTTPKKPPQAKKKQSR
jgi:hypothetical protein